MRKTIQAFLLCMAACIILPGKLVAQDFPEKPNPPRLVNDFAGMLKQDEINALETKLVAFDDSTTTQIAIVTVKSLQGYDKADYAQRLFDKWGIGQKGKNNGVLILIKPKTPGEDGQIFITQGYGLEGAIPDLPVSEIIDREILPSFREGNYYAGLDKATDIMMRMARGEFPAGSYAKGGPKGTGDKSGQSILVVIILIAFVIIAISSRGGGQNNRHISSKGLPFWMLMAMMNSGNSHSGSWGGFSGGGGGGFGGGGGGFGGFGGGMSGGGGAGGSW